MTKFTLLSVAALLSAVVATPSFAEPAISEPGLFAFYHPMGDLGIASKRPLDANARQPEAGSVASMRMHVRSQPVQKRY
jgi:hypothetical protein